MTAYDSLVDYCHTAGRENAVLASDADRFDDSSLAGVWTFHIANFQLD